MKGDEEKARAAGCDGYIAKPIDIDSLPRRDRRAPRLAAGDAMSAAPILVVEDNAATRKMMRLALQAEGYSVLEAEDGQTALRLAAEHAPALVLLDCKLPDMDGFEVARRLRALGAGPPHPRRHGLGAGRRGARPHGGLLGRPREAGRAVAPRRDRRAARRVTRSRNRPRAGRTVLLADDDPTQRKLGQLALTNAGFDGHRRGGRRGRASSRAGAQARRHPERRAHAADGRVRALQGDPRAIRRSLACPSS